MIPTLLRAGGNCHILTAPFAVRVRNQETNSVNPVPHPSRSFIGRWVGNNHPKQQTGDR
jgi:hypothetical protein